MCETSVGRLTFATGVVKRELLHFKKKGGGVRIGERECGMKV